MHSNKTKLQGSWLALEFAVRLEQEDLACWLMLQHGAKGCEVKSQNNSLVSIQAVFELKDLTNKELETLKASLEEFGLTACLKTLKTKTIYEEDWLSKWKEGFEPFTVGEHFLVCPSWLTNKLSPEDLHKRRLLIIEPGMAFGTGLHATTRYCLRALEKYLASPNILDVGSGSGILSIAASLLNTECKVTGVDVDPMAIRSAQENLKLNNLTERIEFKQGSTELVRGKTYNTILSNLTCEDIITLLPEYEKLTAPQGIVICAGILKEKLPLLEHALLSTSFIKIDQEIDGHWVGLVLQNQPDKV